MNKAIIVSLCLVFLLLGFMPAVFASPITANLNWSPNPTTQGSTTVATYGVGADADCPTTFTGTLTVTTPLGGTSTVTVGSTACGTTNLHSTYPTDFTGAASTTECGTYTATWSGHTSVVALFSTLDTFTVTCPRGVPQFPTPAIFVVAIGLALLMMVKKFKFATVPLSKY